MKRIVVVCIALAVLSVSAALAKRPVPDEIIPIKSGDIEYRTPHGQMGCVEAWDTKRSELIWRRQVYVVKYTIGLERDVQDVFITVIELKDEILVVKNERKSEYEVDIESLQVKMLKGSLVENLK
jgi:hypothetical protein